MIYYSWPIGGAVTKLMWHGQSEVTMAHTKFGTNMSKLCRDTASDVFWHLTNKFVDALNENSFIYRLEIHNFSSAHSEDDPNQIWWKSD